jgi:hypothetical protein
MRCSGIQTMKKAFIPALALSLAAGAALAKLPPLSDEAKAKAAEAAAKTAHAGKLDSFLLCRSMERVAARYQADAKKAGKEAKPPTATPPCADPGPFVYPPPAAAAAAPAATPAPAPAKAPAKKA